MSTGTVVWYCEDNEKDLLGLFVKADGDKDIIQTVEGNQKPFAYREPGDRLNDDKGVTWWKVAIEPKGASAPAPGNAASVHTEIHHHHHDKKDDC